MITGPTTIGGKNLSIKLFPLIFTKKLNAEYTKPAKNTPPMATGRPHLLTANEIGAMKAKLLAKKIGTTFWRQIS